MSPIQIQFTIVTHTHIHTHKHIYYKISYDTIMESENYQDFFICYLDTQEGQSVPRTIDSLSSGKQEHRDRLDV